MQFVCYYYQMLLPLLPFLIQHVRGVCCGSFSCLTDKLAAHYRSSHLNIFVCNEAHISVKTCVLGWQWI